MLRCRASNALLSAASLPHGSFLLLLKEAEHSVWFVSFFFLSLVLQFSFFLSCFLPFLSLYFTDSKRLRQYYYCYFLLSYLTLWLYEAEYKEPLSLQEHRISSIP